MDKAEDITSLLLVNERSRLQRSIDIHETKAKDYLNLATTEQAEAEREKMRLSAVNAACRARDIS